MPDVPGRRSLLAMAASTETPCRPERAVRSPLGMTARRQVARPQQENG